MITLVVAAPAIIRRGLRLILESQPDFKVVGEAADSIETGHIVEELKPSVLVTTGGFDGLELARMLGDGDRGPNVVILLDSSEKGLVHRALKAGAKACILVDSDPEELVNAIREVAKGRYYLSPQLSQDLIRESASGEIDRYDSLTVRERQILRLAGGGCSNDQIAHQLGISRRTVEVHRTTMMRKMGFHDKNALLMYAVEHRITRAAE